MLDKTTLSKQKHIYYVYNSGNETHIEKFPVVYLNSKYVYFKRQRQDELSRVYLSFVKDSLQELKDPDHFGSNCFAYERDRYYWNMEDNPQEFIKELKEKFEVARRKKYTADAKRELERKQKAYEEALKKFEMYAKLEEEENEHEHM